MLEIKSREEEAILLEHEQALLLKEKLVLEKAVSCHSIYAGTCISVFLLLGGTEKSIRTKTNTTGI